MKDALNTGAADTLPDAIVFYDGDCALCNSALRLVASIRHRRNDPGIFVAPLGGSTAAALLSYSKPLPDSLVLLERDSRRQTGFRISFRTQAIVRILWNLGGPWRGLAVSLWLVPVPIRDLAYAGIARVRRFWPGNHTCSARKPLNGIVMLP